MSYVTVRFNGPYSAFVDMTTYGKGASGAGGSVPTEFANQITLRLKEHGIFGSEVRFSGNIKQDDLQIIEKVLRENGYNI